MRRNGRTAVLALSEAAAAGGGGAGTRPSIWLDTATLARVTAKKNSGSDTDWNAIKSAADSYAAATVPSYTLATVSNAKPAVATLSANVPWADTETVYLGGATGSWITVNAGEYPGLLGVKTGTTTFELWAGGPSVESITRGSTTTVTLTEDINWTGTPIIQFQGFLGGWANMNASIAGNLTATQTGARTFTVPFNTTSYPVYVQATHRGTLVAPNVHFVTKGTTTTLELWLDVLWTGTAAVKLHGFTGEWAALNGTRSATRTGTNTCTVPVNTSAFGTYDYGQHGGTVSAFPVDSTAFGSFSGQTIVVFPYDSVSFAYQGSGWWDRAQALALCYKILGNSPTAYGTKAVQWLDYIVGLGKNSIRRPVSADSFYSTRFTLPSIAIIYDWCYDLLTSQQKTNYATAVNFWFDNAVVEGGALDWFASDHERLQSNYFTGHVWGIGSAGLAGTGDNARAAEIVAAVRSKIDTYVLPAFASGGHAEGGYPFESYGYGTNGYERLLYYLDALKTATGENLSDDAPQLADSLIYNLRPDRWRAGDEGDYPGAYTGILIKSYPIVLAHVLAGTLRGGWMQYLYNNIVPTPNWNGGGTGAGQDIPTLTRLLWYDSGGTSFNYTSTEPLGKWSPGDHRLFCRSDWTSSAVWMGMNGSSQNAVGSHQARTGGHLEILRGDDPLMLYAGQMKGSNGVCQTAGGTGELFQLNSGLSNTLWYSDGGAHTFTGTAYWGGQGYWGVNDVLARDVTPEYAYASTSLVSAYDGNSGAGGRTLTTYKRSIVMLGSVAVVFDYAVRDTTARTAYWRWHFIRDASVSTSTNTATVSLGASKLFIRTWMPGSTAEATPTLTSEDVLDNFEAGTGTARAKVLKVQDAGTPSTTLRQLTHFRADATAASAPTVTLITATGNTAYGLSTVDGATTRVVMFAASGGELTSLEYAA